MKYGGIDCYAGILGRYLVRLTAVSAVPYIQSPGEFALQLQCSSHAW